MFFSSSSCRGLKSERMLHLPKPCDSKSALWIWASQIKHYWLNDRTFSKKVKYHIFQNVKHLLSQYVLAVCFVHLVRTCHLTTFQHHPCSPPAVFYLLIKADRWINQRLWPRRSDPRRASCSASQLLSDDWQLSCPHHCSLIFVRSHLSDRGSEGLLSRVDGSLHDAAHEAPPAAERCL